MTLKELEKIGREKLPEPLLYENDTIRVIILKDIDVLPYPQLAPTPFDKPYELEFRKIYDGTIAVEWEFVGLVSGGI